jgi:hypothetical protein
MRAATKIAVSQTKNFSFRSKGACVEYRAPVAAVNREPC